MGSNLQYQITISLLYFSAQASTDMYMNNDSKSKVTDDKVLDATIIVWINYCWNIIYNLKWNDNIPQLLTLKHVLNNKYSSVNSEEKSFTDSCAADILDEWTINKNGGKN